MSRARFQDPPLQKAGKGANAYYFIRLRLYREDGSSTRKQFEVCNASVSKREANKLKQEVIAKQTGQVLKVITPGGGTATFGDFYRTNFLPMKSHWSEAHRDKSAHLMEKHVLPRFGELPIDSIDKVIVQTHLNTLAKSYAESTVKHVRAKISEVLVEALDQDFVSKNPVPKTVIPKEARAPSRPTLTPEQLIALIDKLTDPKDKALFLVATFCALRTSEAFGLPWRNFQYNPKTKTGHFMIDQIAFEGEIFARTKNDASEAKVHIGPRTLKAVLQWQKECPDTSPDALLFPSTNRNGRSEKGAPMWPGAWLTKRIQPVAKEVGISFPVNFRATRRTAATLVQDQGASLASAQGMLRHASPLTTAEVYTQAIPDSVKEAVNDYELMVFAARKLVRVK